MSTETTSAKTTMLALLRAAGFGALVWGGLTFMGVRPTGVVPVIALVVAGLSFVSGTLATIGAVIALCVPVIIVNPVVGLAALLLGFVGVRFLGVDGGRAFLVIGLSIAGAFIGPAWAGVVLAGFLLGPAEGALAAGLAAVLIEAFGLATGRPSIGVVLTGGPCAPLLRLPCPVPLTSPDWLSRVVSGVDSQAVARVFSTAAAAQRPVALVVQPLLWAGAAVLAGLAARASRRGANPMIAYAGVGGTVLALALGTYVMRATFGAPMGAAQTAFATVTSLAVALIGVAISENVFAPKRKPVVRPGTASDDAEVDELLRLIASAEETLAERHTTETYVMMSDMKSFSTMTEEDGSLASAKAIQRHRDLLLPVVEEHGGTGKPSGGDGLVAAFPTAQGALEAAAEMQRVLFAYNDGRPGERPLHVRIGVAFGEVVVDRSGRPFIGVGLNLAARVMGLADGGQSFAGADVAEEAGGVVETQSLGAFQLKNIAEPVEVVEVLWQHP